MDLLDRFATMLTQAAQVSPVELRTGDEINKVHADLEKRAAAGGRNYEPEDLQIKAVRRFWESGRIETLREARLVAFGLTANPWGDQRCLMEDKNKFGLALDQIHEWHDVPRQYRKCYQGLVRSYFDYDGMGRRIPDVGRDNWRHLRT
ncbi:conserved hypothetical protein [Cupriavidus taiwanensis]|uniref:EH signature domain-containing protein n=1 Tax=Cupriavidus taiwanensis TaxID=164546 RepID=UPI000E13973D|nr:EH signature domain-containing protein [Cupriavidus taiwanensis]SPA40191.1 conserved hypothetical protein [Cupriavidus taiwanensis]